MLKRELRVSMLKHELQHLDMLKRELRVSMLKHELQHVCLLKRELQQAGMLEFTL